MSGLQRTLMSGLSDIYLQLKFMIMLPDPIEIKTSPS